MLVLQTSTATNIAKNLWTAAMFAGTTMTKFGSVTAPPSGWKFSRRERIDIIDARLECAAAIKGSNFRSQCAGCFPAQPIQLFVAISHFQENAANMNSGFVTVRNLSCGRECSRTSVRDFLISLFAIFIADCEPDLVLQVPNWKPLDCIDTFFPLRARLSHGLFLCFQKQTSTYFAYVTHI